MKKIVFLCLLLICSCEVQPNRPLTAIDIINKDLFNTPIKSKPEPTITPEPSIIKVVFKGQISDFQTRLPLADVDLTIDNEKFKTNIDGKFSIPDFTIGEHELIATKEGYIDYLSNINIKSDFGSVYIFMKKK